MRMPRLWNYQQLSNRHRRALRERLLALHRANFAAYPIGSTLAGVAAQISAKRIQKTEDYA